MSTGEGRVLLGWKKGKWGEWLGWGRGYHKAGGGAKGS